MSESLGACTFINYLILYDIHNYTLNSITTQSFNPSSINIPTELYKDEIFDEKSVNKDKTEVDDNNDLLSLEFPFECQLSFNEIYTSVKKFYDRNKEKFKYQPDIKRDNNDLDNNINYLTREERIDIHDQLYNICNNKEFYKIHRIVSILALKDETLLKYSQKYKRSLNWFPFIYSYIKCFEQIIENKINEIDNINNDNNDIDDIKGNEEDNFLLEYLLSYHIFLQHLLEILIIFETCLDWSYIPILEPVFRLCFGHKFSNIIFGINDVINIDNNGDNSEICVFEFIDFLINPNDILIKSMNKHKFELNESIVILSRMEIILYNLFRYDRHKYTNIYIYTIYAYLITVIHLQYLILYQQNL